MSKTLIRDFQLWSIFSIVVTLPMELELKTYNISENSPINSTIDIMMPGISTRFSNIKVIGDGFDKYFHLNKGNGKIYLIREIDLEDPALCTANQNCCDQNSDCKFSMLLRFYEQLTAASVTFTMHIYINDVNDWSPKFKQDQYVVEYREGVKSIGEKQLLPTAFDKDFSAKNRQIKYRIQIDTEHKSVFQLLTNGENQAPTLLLLNALDCERKNHYLIDLIAANMGGKEGRLLLYIKVMDVNEFSPEFSRDLQTLVSLPESTPINTRIMKINATDNDAYPHNKISYQLDTMNDATVSKTFSIDPNNGELFLINSLDYEKIRRYSLIVIVSDNAPKSERRSTSTSINISVQDVNDNYPEMKFESENKKSTIRENQPIGTQITIVNIIDRDLNQNGDVTCKLPKSENNFFLHKIFEKFYQIESNKIFDREETDRYFLIISCNDHGSPSLTSSSTLTILINDENDQAPQFVKGNFHFKVKENSLPHSSLTNTKNQEARIEVIDPDIVGNISFTIDHTEGHNNITSAIDIDRRSGRLYSMHALDRELVSEIRAKICCNDTVHVACIDIFIVVEDENDNAPYLMNDVFRLSVEENILSLDKPLISFQPRDKDATNLGFRYQFDQSTIGDVYKYFQLDHDKLLIRKPLDREEISSFHFLVQIIDNHPNSERQLHTTAKIFVAVIDQNDNVPQFLFPNLTHYSVNQSCHEPIGHLVTKVIATDPDQSENGTVVYDLVNMLPKNEVNLFHVDRASGEIFINSPSLSDQFCGFNFILMISAKDLGDQYLRNENYRKFPSKSFSKLQITLLDIPRSYSARITHITPRLILTVILSCSTLFLISLLVAWAFIIFCQKNRHSTSKEEGDNKPYYSLNLLNNNMSEDQKIDPDEDYRSETITYIHRDDLAKMDSFSETSASFRPIPYCPVTPTIFINPVASSAGHLCPENPRFNYVRAVRSTASFTPPPHRLVPSPDGQFYFQSIRKRANSTVLGHEPVYVIRGHTLSTPTQHSSVGPQSIYTTLLPHSSVIKFTPAFSSRRDADSFSDTYV